MFHSTRGSKIVSGSRAVIDGLAENGGLYVTDEIPIISYQELKLLSYSEMTAKILAAYFTEFTYEELLEEVKIAYSNFTATDVVDIKHLPNASILELFHGPTAAFKDLALVILPRLLKKSKEIQNDLAHTTILTATSGDTGGATLSGFQSIDNIDVIVLYPSDGVSSLQEAQMQSFNHSNGHVIAVDANFDECQSFVKDFFIKNKELNLSSANSINIGRLIPQIVYYYYSYISLLKEGRIKDDERISFIVPTGNFGDILAGYLAKKMSLPIDKLVCASNENDVLTDFFETRLYDANREFKYTNSPSMDILFSSNLERLLYLESKSIKKVVKQMNSLKKKKRFKVKSALNDFVAYSINQQQTLQIIKKYYTEYNYLMDPHTAVAMGSLEYFKKINSSYCIVVSTASPYKFSQTVLKALNLPGEKASDLADILKEELPKNLSYQSFEKEVVSKEDLERKIKEIIADVAH